MPKLREARGKHANLGFTAIVPYQTFVVSDEQLEAVGTAIADGWFEIIEPKPPLIEENRNGIPLREGDIPDEPDRPDEPDKTRNAD